MDDEALRRLVTKVVTEVVSETRDVSTEIEAEKGRPAQAVFPAGVLAGDDPLARRVAAWLGAPPGPGLSHGVSRGASGQGVRVSGLLAPPESAPPGLAVGRQHGISRAPRLGSTPARLAVGRAGVRLRTGTLLQFLEDHAAARDAVASEVDPELVTSMGLLPLASAARDRGEFLLRPDLGRRLAPESAERLKAQARSGAQVQIVVADGLSGTAVRVTCPRVLPVLLSELEAAGVQVGTPVFVANGRMVVGDEVGRLVSAEVVCTLLGERPGLVTAESLGGYVTYLHAHRINDSMRSMVSNMHEAGLDPQQGARQLAALCVQALRERRTGVAVAT